MNEMTCPHCGGNQFKRVDNLLFQCLYCWKVYDEDGREIISNADEITSPLIQTPGYSANSLRRPLVSKPGKSSRKKVWPWIIVVISFALVLRFVLSVHSHSVSSKPEVKLTNMLKISSIKVTDFKFSGGGGSSTNTSSSSSSSTTQSWDDDQLNNPNQLVYRAELSLQQEEIDRARASVEKFGGKNTRAYTERLDEAQADHDRLKQEFEAAVPAPDVIKSDERDNFGVTSYYSEKEVIAAWIPDFDQYDEAQIREKWGEPDMVITAGDTIRKHLSPPEKDENGRYSVEGEYARLFDEWETGSLSWRELKAYNIMIYDLHGGSFTKELVYEDQGKPNVFLDENGKVGYVSPIIRYVMFPRNGEKYPDIGFKKSFPTSYPKNYQFPKGPTAAEVKKK